MVHLVLETTRQQTCGFDGMFLSLAVQSFQDGPGRASHRRIEARVR